jgi:hypothetical protein
MRMIRKQVYIDPQQEEKLKTLSKRLGVTEAELIRRGIELVGDDADLDKERRRVWQQELAYMRQRAAENPGIPGGKRDWTRDESYDERPKYLSRRL